MFAIARRHHQSGRLNEAKQIYEQILQLDARHADALHCLGILAHQVGRNDVAVDLIAKAIAQGGRVPAFQNNLGNALMAQGKLPEAVVSYGWALAHKPDYVEAHYNLGVALQAQGDLPGAEASYRRALTFKPSHAAAYNNLGNALQGQDRLDEAAASYGRALMLEPNYAEAHGNLANVLKAQGKLDEALASYERALIHKPDYAEAHSNLGIILLERGRLDEAVASYERALIHKPDYAEAHNYLGHALQTQGRTEEALASYARALAQKPDYAEARLGSAMAVIPLFADSVAAGRGIAEKFTRSLDDLAAWGNAHPGKLGKAVGSTQPFHLPYRPGDAAVSLRRYGDLVCAAAAASWRPEPDDRPAVRAPGNRIRMGVVCGQVRRHPVWDIVLRGLIAHLDRRRFEIFIYHTGAMADDETAWARSRVDRFVQGPEPTRRWLEEIARDAPDVLFYPEVGMDPATGALAALRLAPMQVAGWGHPVTTGLPSMDLFLSGELLEGPRAELHYREKLVRLAGTGVCTEPPAAESRHWEGPARQGGIVRFALCQQPIKFDPANDILLARIAVAAAPCEFWLASPKNLPWTATRLRERLAAVFRAQGLDPESYLRLTPWLPREQFDGFLDEMDLYLDCPAFSGYTTAWQAIRRGLPIVTLEGEFLRQRLAAGLLRQIGVTDGIASSEERYVQIAIDWARECRSGSWTARRETLRHAAPKADGNVAAVHAFEHTVSTALQALHASH
jgi:predicted O-linked N-acetylglucosamine transferase (SPINDLY family)